jgi:hypothetical protein
VELWSWSRGKQGQAAGAISVVGKAVRTLYPPLRPLSHNVNPRDGAQDINYKLRILREHIKEYNSGHENPAFSAMANSQAQELPFPTRYLGLCAAPEIHCPFCKSSTESHCTGAGKAQRRAAPAAKTGSLKGGSEGAARRLGRPRGR